MPRAGNGISAKQTFALLYDFWRSPTGRLML